MPRPPNVSRVKALHATAGSAAQARPIQEQVAHHTAVVDPHLTTSAPRVITVDTNAAYPQAMTELKASGVLPQAVKLRQVKDVHNLIEQDHRFIKRLVKPGVGFFSVETAGRTLQGYQVLHLIRKGQVKGVSKGDITEQVAFIASRFGVAAYTQPPEELHVHRVAPRFFCNTTCCSSLVLRHRCCCLTSLPFPSRRLTTLVQGHTA